MRIFLWIILALAAFLVFKNIFTPDTWQGFYYPNEASLLSHIASPVFNSLEECRDWVDEQVQKYNPEGYGYDYECGRNCRPRKEFTALVCEETIK